VTPEEQATMEKYFKPNESNPLKLETWNTPPSEIIKGLWVGSWYDVENTALLGNLNIQSIINVMGTFPTGMIVGVPYVIFPLNQPFGDTKPFAEQAASMISKFKSAGMNKVFIHCLSGIDRAPTVVWKFLVDTGMSKDDALYILKEKRNIARPHPDWFR
jgi:hypothetical protein